MPRAFLVLVLIGFFGLAAQGEEAQGPDADEQDAMPEPAPIDLDEILNNPLSESEYREQKKCVRIRDVDDVEVLDETLVLFHGRRGELWLNQLTSQCYGLEQEMILRFRAYAGTYCRLDPFRGVPYFSRIAITAECRLGDFEPVDEIQVEALRIAVAERQEVSDMAKETRRQERRRTRSSD
ncbi:MAG: hypothetical protein OXH15_12575 [Gammaproteobacteria bacterium]|nr:hypothetical protein [Gammaproteobacteria bacterium]